MDYFEFSFYSNLIGTTYRPHEILESMGRVWVLERGLFQYSLCPQDRYSILNMNEYRREWEYRLEESIRMRQELRQCCIKAPKQKSLEVTEDNDESLEKAVNMVRHENNQMQIRINRHQLVHAACRRHDWARTIPDEMDLQNYPEYCTDGDLSDE